MATDSDQAAPSNVTILQCQKRIIYRKSNSAARIFIPDAVLNDEITTGSAIDKLNLDLDDAVRDTIEYMVSSVETEINLYSSENALFFTNAELSKLAVLQRLKYTQFKRPNENLLAPKLPVGPSLPTSQMPDSTNYFHQTASSSHHNQLFQGIKRRSSQQQPVVQKKKVVNKLPQFCSGNMTTLEPGEIPSEKFVPPKPDARILPVYCVVYPCPPYLMNVPFNLFNYVDLDAPDYGEEYEYEYQEPTTALNQNCNSFSVEGCQPSKSITELFRIAKENVDAGRAVTANGELSKPYESVFPCFPTTGESDAKKMNKREKRKLGRLYRVKFSNDLAMLRHHANRWIRGGRLSTTGKFIEASEDDLPENLDFASQSESILTKEIMPNSEGGDQPKTKCPLATIQENYTNCIEDNYDQVTPVPVPPKKYNTHVIYEDTHQYENYSKFWAELHGHTVPRESEQQAWQRKWYQYYSQVVKFVDIPDESLPNSNSGEPSNSENDDLSKNITENMELFYQQWRWKQIHQHNSSLNRTSSNNDQNTANGWTNGVSYGSEPVVYKNCSVGTK